MHTLAYRLSSILMFLFFSSVMLCADEQMEYVEKLKSADFNQKNLGLRCTFSGGALKGKLVTNSGATTWSVTKAKEGKGWSALGVELRNKKLSSSCGFRLVLELPQALDINIEARQNTTPDKGFWTSKWLGRKTYTIPAGKQIIEKTWAELGVKSANWHKVNAVSFSISRETKIGLYSFGLLYQKDVDAETSNLVKWYDYRDGKINPVSRALDKLTGVFCTNSGKGFTSKLVPSEITEPSPVVRWQVTSPSPEHKGWATYGFGFIDPIEPTLDGLRFEVSLKHDTELSINVLKGFSRRRGFYPAKPTGKANKIKLTAGKHFINVLWDDFGVAEKIRDQVNSVRFAVNQPTEIDILKVELYYGNPADAAMRKTIENRKLAELQKVLIDSLATRGVNWTKSMAALSPEKAEKNIWTAMQLSAQREQLTFYKNIYNPATADQLMSMNSALIARGKDGDFGGLREEAEKLQKAIDSYIDQAIAKTPQAKRSFHYDENEKVFRGPDGKIFRMFGPHFFRAMYRPGLFQWRKWDFRYLSGLGFNGIRLHVTWTRLEPEQGKFDPEFLSMLKDIMKEAERYGFAVSVDLHWPYPKWFLDGNPDFESGPRKFDKANSYHWPEALVDSWQRLGEEFSSFSNILAFEVPTNETPIGSRPDGLMASKYLMKRWNEFLRNEYVTRDALQAVWSAAAEGAKRYALKENENWDDNSILPLGFQEDASPADAYCYSPRFYDHLRFVVMMQREVSGNIVSVLRKNRPDAMGMFQRTIGDNWDHSPVPVNYHSIMTCTGENVLAGTHYNMGTIHARKAASLTRGSYDSEQQMEGSQKSVKRHIDLGLGFCPFTFHHRGGGGMLLADDDWHLKPEVAYLSKMANEIRYSVPAEPKGKAVAVISNCRLYAGSGESLNELVAALDERKCKVGVFESLNVIDQPQLLNGYEVVILSSAYLDEKLLKILSDDFSGKVLLTGRLDMDAYARKQDMGLPKFLADNKLLLTDYPVKPAAELAGELDLAGSWDFYFSGENSKALSKPITKPNDTKKINVPGMWGETELTGSLKYLVGDGWYFRNVKIPASWKGRPLQLNVGGIDDLDWVFFNGKLIGHTGEDTPNYWMVKRQYSIPEELVKYGEENELVIAVRNLRGDAGIIRHPISITGSSKGSFSLAKGRFRADVPCDGATSLVPITQLNEQAQVIGYLELSDSDRKFAALVRQGKIFWYFNNHFMINSILADKYTLDMVLSTH